MTLDDVYVSGPAGRPDRAEPSRTARIHASSGRDPRWGLHMPAIPIEPTGDSHQRDEVMLLVVRGQDPGAFGFAAISVDYRIGPMTFDVVHHLALRVALDDCRPGHRVRRSDTWVPACVQINGLHILLPHRGAESGTWAGRVSGPLGSAQHLVARRATLTQRTPSASIRGERAQARRARG